MSIRALESELGRTFPGIKKQIDGLEEAEVLHIDKTPEKWAIKIRDDIYEEIRKLILVSLKWSIRSYLQTIPAVQKLYFWKLFDKQIEVDLVILYKEIKTPEELEELKKHITDIFKSYLIDPAYLVFMDSNEFEKRTKMADKFALSLVRSNQ